MKKTMIIAAIMAGVAAQAMAADPVNSPSATTHSVKSTLQQHVMSLLQPKTTLQTDKIERVGNISSRPWSQTAASYSTGGPSLFAGDRERFHNVQFNLFWAGSTPP
jgi:hypothetical protein